MVAGGREGVWRRVGEKRNGDKREKRECRRVGEKGNGGRRERKIIAAGGSNGGR